MFRGTAHFLLLSLGLVSLAAPARADYPIKTRTPTVSDYRAAVKAARAVNREVPMSLKATSKPQAKAIVRDGAIHERSGVIVNADYDTFMKRFDANRWSINLPQRWGGQVSTVQNRQREGRGTALQQERMILGVPLAQDLTKDVVVIKGKNRSIVRWHSTHSDRSLPTLLYGPTVKQDDGSIEFRRTKDNRVEIIGRSVHRVSMLPLLPVEKVAPTVAAKLTAFGLERYWVSIMDRYQAIGEGRLAAK